jgi:hypothetical protein
VKQNLDTKFFGFKNQTLKMLFFSKISRPNAIKKFAQLLSILLPLQSNLRIILLCYLCNV